MQIIICDDSKEDRDFLKQNIHAYGLGAGIDYIIREFECAETLLESVKNGSVCPNILFMDIYMDGMNGMDAVKELKTQGFQGAVIFTTTSETHSIESYKIMADGYLLKPYSREEFNCNFDRVVRVYLESFKTISFLCERLEFRIFLKDLEFVVSAPRGSFLHAKGKILRTTKSVSEFVQELGKEVNFLQCHRSCLVNLNYVDRVETDFVQMKSGAKAPLAMQSRQIVKKAAADYFFMKMRED